ncbi:MAG: D-alanyl-D-alanine carboxypeptidase [Candidatus Pacebacteria bacterium]|nr:D-alanyl-D-alanine carboxypeptidase [Candidatus Paceibacterota bacterium]
MTLPRLSHFWTGDKRWLQAGAAIIVLSIILGILTLFFPIVQKPPSQTAVLPTFSSERLSSVRVTAKAAIVYDLTTGETLYEKNAEAQLPLASLTKLLTVYAALGAIPKETRITISDSALAVEGESGLALGESFTFERLAKLALVASSNDAAAAIAETASTKKGVAKAALMGSAITAAKLTQTYAVNGTGLDESTNVSGAYGSARDVALLSGALLAAAPELASATVSNSVSVYSEEGALHTLQNTNQHVSSQPGTLLSKTGFTDLAGGNLAVVFDASFNHPIAVVVLGSTKEGRFSDVEALMDATLDGFAYPDAP